jgi:serine/threonine-protein kinase
VLTQTRFGAYTGLELIGRGGMAEVYKSTHPTLGTPVAIKLLPAHLAAEPDFRKRFTREAEVVSKLQHPNIVRLFDFGEDAEAGTHYMVMEYLGGKDLGAYLREKGKLALAEALPLIRQIASALDYAHAQGLVHRDIKPSNVMLDAKDEGTLRGMKDESSSFIIHPSSFRAVLTDFGIAKILGGHTAMTRTGGMLGTFDYIAPEQIQASADVDRRADVYAFGVLTYEMLTGELPFGHSNVGALLLAHLNQPPPDPRNLVPDLTSDAAHAIRRAMAKSPAERFATAGEFAAALA